MLFVDPHQLISETAHLPNETMFHDISCILIPKLPVSKESRDVLLKLYWPYLSEFATRSFENELWTAYRLAAAPDGFNKP